METGSVAHLHGQNTPTKMSKARSFDQSAAAGATPTTGYEPVCKLRRTHSATSRRESLYHLEHSHDYRSTEGDSSTMESNLQTNKDMVCRLCVSEIDAVDGGSSKLSKMFEGQVCETCRNLAEYTPGYESSKETLLTEEHKLISEQVVMDLEHSHDYQSTEGDSSTMESNLVTNKDMVCRLCVCEIDAVDDYKGGSSKVSKMFKGRVCETCRIIAEYTPGYESSKETLLTEEEHKLISEQVVMELRRKQLCRILPEIKLMVRNSRSRTTGEKPSSGNLSSKDEDDFDSDEEIDIPTVQGWFKLLTSKQQETNGEEAILALVAKVKELEMSEPSFNIYIDAFYSKEDRSSRQGAVLRDFHNRPIAAWSNIDYNVESISTLHNERKGLSLGLEMAIKYQVTNFYIYCPSSAVLMILRSRICPCNEAKPGACRKCALPLLSNKEETFQLLLKIFALI